MMASSKSILLTHYPVKLLKIFNCKRDGYETKNVDNYAGHFTFWWRELRAWFLAYMDVVPAGSAWEDGSIQTRNYRQVLPMVRSMIRVTTWFVTMVWGSLKTQGLPVLSACALLSVRMKNQDGETWIISNMSDFLSQILATRCEFPIINGERNITEYLHYFKWCTQEVPIFHSCQVASENIRFERPWLQSGFLDNYQWSCWLLLFFQLWTPTQWQHPPLMKKNLYRYDYRESAWINSLEMESRCDSRLPLAELLSLILRCRLSAYSCDSFTSFSMKIFAGEN